MSYKDYKHKIALMFNFNKPEEKFAYDFLSKLYGCKTSYITGLIIKDLKEKGLNPEKAIGLSFADTARIYHPAINAIQPAISESASENKNVVNEDVDTAFTTTFEDKADKEIRQTKDYDFISDNDTETSEQDDDFDYDAYVRDMASVVEGFGLQN